MLFKTSNSAKIIRESYLGHGSIGVCEHENDTIQKYCDVKLNISQEIQEIRMKNVS